MPTSVRLGRELELRLDRLAAETGRTKAYYIRHIIAEGIEDAEDYYLGNEALERIRRGQDKLIPAEEVYTEFGLDR